MEFSFPDPKTMIKPKILIAEGDAVISAALNKMLDSSGYETVCICASSEEMSDNALLKRPDLILMDIHLPGKIDCLEAVLEIRQRLDIPFVYLIKKGDFDTVRRSDFTMPYGYLIKPINKIDLFINVDSALNRQMAEKKLKQSEEKYRLIVENSLMGIIIMGPDLSVTFANRVAAEFFGYGTGELNGVKITDFLYEEDLPAFREIIRQRAEGITGDYIQRVKRRDGGIAWIQVSASPLFGDDGKVSGFLAMLSDITEKFNIQKSLAESEEKYRRIFESVTDGVIILDPGGRIVSANPRACEMYGYGPGGMIGLHGRDFIHPDKFHLFESFLKDGLEGIEFATESIEVRKNGSSFPSEIRAKAFEYEGGQHFLAVIADLTEKKNTEEAFRIIAETSNDVIFQVDINGIIHYCSPSIEKHTGYAVDEMVGSHFSKFITEDQVLDISEQFGQVLMSEKIERLEACFINKNGKKRFIELSVSNIVKNGIVVGIQGSARDISERKRAEREIEESRNLLKNVIEFLPDATLAVDTDGRILIWNRAMETMTGMRSEEMIGKGDLEYSLPFYGTRRPMMIDLALGNMDLTDAGGEYNNLTTGGGLYTAEAYAPRIGDGSYLWIAAKPIYGSDGGIIGAIESVRNITDKRISEEKLKESEEKYRLFAEGSTDIIYYLDTSGVVEFCSPSVERILGFDPSEIIGGNIRDFVAEGEGQFIENKFQEALNCIDIFSMIFDVSAKNGSLVTLEMMSIPVFKNEKRVGVQGIARDITQRIKSENEVMESKKFLASIIDFLPDPTFVLDGKGKVIIWNRAIEKITGMRAEDMFGMGGYEYALAFYGEKRPLLVDIVLDAELKEKMSGHYDYLSYDGDAVTAEAFLPKLKGGLYLWGIAKPLYDSGGDLIGAIESVRDITDKKAAEMKLKESEERFRALTENSYDVIMRFDRQLRHLYVNPIVEDQTGIPAKDFIGKTHEELGFPPELVRLWAGAITEVFETKNQKRIEFQLPTGLWIDWLLIPEFSHDNLVKAVIASARDITERKMSEERLLASLREKDVLIREVHHRVKNNFQVIISLINLQRGKTKNRDVINELGDSKNRIRAMALIHEKLYRSADLSMIDFANYLESIAKELNSVYSGRDRGIELKFDLEKVSLGIDQAIPCGLIVNELITNSFKHAFTARGLKEMQILLCLSEKRGMVKVSVGDNGIGMPGGLLKGSSGTLGLALVNLLTEQLNAKISLHGRSKRGVAVSIKFMKKVI
ncbi:MAG: PAS domain S-box protein [Spirochaetes bacterium]|jgi:PAS domain S-box-containing protein|nr:PAS domain S-box protein [Spirochaetota bacterium]